jgi:hypothetical protein
MGTLGKPHVGQPSAGFLTEAHMVYKKLATLIKHGNGHISSASYYNDNDYHYHCNSAVCQDY